MKLPKNLGMILLSIWLIATGLSVFVPAIAAGVLGSVWAIVAIAAGVLLLLGR